MINSSITCRVWFDVAVNLIMFCLSLLTSSLRFCLVWNATRYQYGRFQNKNKHESVWGVNVFPYLNNPWIIVGRFFSYQPIKSATTLKIFWLGEKRLILISITHYIRLDFNRIHNILWHLTPGDVSIWGYVRIYTKRITTATLRF